MLRLSSDITFVYKVIFPLFYLTIASLVGLAFLFGDSKSTQHLPLFFLPVFTLLPLAIFYWVCFPLKNVFLTQEGLLVKGLKKQIMVRFDDIERVSRSFIRNPETIFIHLKRDSEFGRCICFAPELRFWRFSDHPTYIELKRIVDTSRSRK